MVEIGPDVEDAEWHWSRKPLVETVPLKLFSGADVKFYFSVFRRFVEGLTGSCFMKVSAPLVTVSTFDSFPQAISFP